MKKTTKKAPVRKWFTVIGRYQDEPQTIADWCQAPTAAQAAASAKTARSGECEILAVLPGRHVLTWTPED